MRQLKPTDVTFTLEREDDDRSFHDEEFDEEARVWVKDQLNQGNEWAWCQVKVVARWHEFEGVDYLGGCSYRSEAEFRSDGYFADMQERALEDLNGRLAKLAAALKELED